MTTNEAKEEKVAFTIIGVVSVLVLAFLFWLIYFKEAAEATHSFVADLPALNAFLNGLTTILLMVGYIFIKKKKVKAHIASMSSAVFTSGLFLVSYVIYHHFQGDTKFLGVGFVRPVYFFILITHIILSMVVVPLVFSTLFFALRKKYEKHRKVAKITFPIWIYVSITGVMIFFFLKAYS
jgi:putative membrane protein